VTINGDTLFETNETLHLNLNTPVNATLTDSLGVGTITDNDAAASIAVVSGNNQSTVVNTAFAAPLVAEVRNAGGALVQGVSALFTAPGVGASAVFSTTTNNIITTTNASGLASSGTFSANGTAGGPYTVTAQAVGGTSPSTNFTLTNLPPTTLSINDVALSEGDAGTKIFTFTVTANPVNPAATVTVNFATADGTATTADGDYVAGSGTLTFAPSVSTQTINITTNGDMRFEGDETFFVNLSGPTNAALSDNQGVGSINNDDAAPSLSINDVTLAEGNGGTTAFTFTVSQSAASGLTTTLNYTTADGSAIAGSDYSATSGTLTFAPGETLKTVTVLVTGDTVFEADQTFFLNLSGPTNATIADGQGVGTITNDDAAPTLAIDDTGASEAAGTVTFTVTRIGATEVPITTDYATADGTAVSQAGSSGTPDYVAASGTLTFAPSLAATATQTFSVSLTSDSVFESLEQFVVNLSNPTGATIADGQGVGTITDDDAAPTVSIDDVTDAESNGPLTFTVILVGATALPISVDYVSADGTAVSASSVAGTPDYTATSGTLTFSPSASSTQTLTVAVPITDDTTFEATEQFVVNLSNPTNSATISDGQGVGTITNDDTAPTISIAAAETPEGNAGTTNLSFTVSLSDASGAVTTVNYATVDGTAVVADNDYVTASGTLTFAAGETSQAVTVVINGDTKVEPTETFSVQLSAPSGATLGTSTATGTITNDDMPVVTANTALIPQAATTLTINGSSFDPTAANNTVVFNLGTAGTVTTATTQSLMVTFTTNPTTGGALTAVVSVAGISSGAPVQVATVDALPIAQDDIAFVKKNTSVDIDVLLNDSDSGGDTLTITAVSTPASGTATIIENGLKIRYTPTANAIVPDTFTYTVSDSNNNTATANVFVGDQLTAQAGTYNGLIQPAIGTTPTNGHVGLVKVTINASTGKFTGTLRLGSESFPTSGTFGTDGKAAFGNTGTANFAVKRKNASELRLTLQLVLAPVIVELQGALTDGGVPFAVLAADRALYTAKANPAAPYENVPANLLGKYTVAFVAKSPQDQGLPAVQYPQGHGHGFLTVSASGTVKLTATLADGTKTAATNALTTTDRWPFYAALAKGQGSIGGFTLFRDQPGVSDLDSLDVSWFKPANAAAKYYPNGWPAGIEADLLGSKLTIPPTTPPTSIFTGLPPADADGNASIAFADGNLAGGGFAKAVNITPQNTATAVTPGADQLFLTLRGAAKKVPKVIGFYEDGGTIFPLIQYTSGAATPLGTFSGRFTPAPGQKPTNYRGVLLQKQGIGYGYFLGTQESGAAELSQQ